jgi:hypothetical protein
VREARWEGGRGYIVALDAPPVFEVGELALELGDLLVQQRRVLPRLLQLCRPLDRREPVVRRRLLRRRPSAPAALPAGPPDTTQALAAARAWATVAALTTRVVAAVDFRRSLTYARSPSCHPHATAHNRGLAASQNFQPLVGSLSLIPPPPSPRAQTRRCAPAS